MDVTESVHATRVSAYATVGTHLSLLSDRRLADAVSAAESLGSGIGGRSAEMRVAGTRVFVKRVPLTDIELQPAHVRSTANVFDLPLFYQYGVGSAGFGAWRELAAHIMTTGWVLKGEHAGFPLLYHWRVLPDSPPAGFADGFGGVEGAVAHWDGSPAVRRRLEAIGRSSSSLVLFMEHVPRTLGAWLAEARDATPGGHSPCLWVEDAVVRGTEFMSARGLVHFDAHFSNLLTDGRQVYFADFGLALSRGFDLSAEERAFLTDHLVYDRCYAPSHLLRHHLPDSVRTGADHGTFLREWVAGRRPSGVPNDISAIIDRHARHAIILDDFHHRLMTQSKRTPFPTADVQRALGSVRPSM
ncbi:serine/threonine-protein kinase [Streptomyces cocklensis]|uniref:Protein kinase domain-containing protein n=1 Tax=Actinacidiphila cocklensis TaxID=887465 RepID=A0A9W4GQV3_9ACTN|nr:serine/threonine-protein kinase [Actinacidiphila cocklensis]MDD1063240.1 serine/threonine-protein kinase [Actinacidiphila cocklensis]CAG6393676.1 Protein kinase domain-containing protein [Actinacidiphila cocklensis]